MSTPDDPGDLSPIGRYSRTEKSASDIRLLAPLELQARVAAFGEADERSPQHRTIEALVHFILEAIASNDHRTTNALFKILSRRCIAAMRAWVRGIPCEEDRLDIQSRVLEQVTRRLVKGGEPCDFLQARFWRYLKLRTISAIAEHRRMHREPLVDDLAAGEEEDSASPFTELRDRELSPEDRLLLADALATLPPELRETFILRHYAGWRVGDERKEDTDPNDPTLMEYFGLSRRAIDKRLAKAEMLLERYRKE